MTDAPVIQPFSFIKNLKVGQKTLITCSVTDGTEPFEFSWTKDGQPVTSSHIEISKSDIDSTLRFKPIKSEDTGEYKCIVRNPFGSASHSAVLFIESECIFFKFVQKKS